MFSFSEYMNHRLLKNRQIEKLIDSAYYYLSKNDLDRADHTIELLKLLK